MGRLSLSFDAIVFRSNAQLDQGCLTSNKGVMLGFLGLCASQNTTASFQHSKQVFWFKKKVRPLRAVSASVYTITDMLTGANSQKSGGPRMLRSSVIFQVIPGKCEQWSCLLHVSLVFPVMLYYPIKGNSQNMGLRTQLLKISRWGQWRIKPRTGFLVLLSM